MTAQELDHGHAGTTWNADTQRYEPLPVCSVSWCARAARRIIGAARWPVCDYHAGHLRREQ